MPANIARQSHSFLKPVLNCTGSGIYAIINSHNLKIYVGSAVRLNHRWNCHRSELAQLAHGNRYLQRAVSKDPDAFHVELIEEVPSRTKEDLLAREQFWMDFYRSYEHWSGYNIAPKAASCRGIKRDPEYVARVAKSLTGLKHSEQAKANMRAAQARIKRKPHSPQARANMRIAHIGLPWSEKRRKAVMPPVTWCCKPVQQFTMDGKFIREFSSITEAEKHLGGRSNIHSVCKGKRPHCFGFVWRYKNAR